MKFRLRESNTVLDSGFPAMDSGFQVLSGPWILDTTLSGIRVSLSCIPDSKAQDSRVDKQNFPGFQGFQFLQPKISRILETGFPCIGRISHKVRTLFWQKKSRTFKGLSRTHFPFFKDSIQCKEEPWVYVFFSSSRTWAILSWRSFCVCWVGQS